MQFLAMDSGLNVDEPLQVLMSCLPIDLNVIETIFFNY